MSAFTDWLMFTWTMCLAGIAVVRCGRIEDKLNEMLRSRAPAPGHSAAETSAPRQPWMTDAQARRYGDGT